VLRVAEMFRYLRVKRYTPSFLFENSLKIQFAPPQAHLYSPWRAATQGTGATSKSAAREPNAITKNERQGEL